MTSATLSDAALEDLWVAKARIAEDSPKAAASFQGDVVNAAKRLATFPNSGVVREDWTSRAVRFLTLPRFHYVLVYNPASSPPEIVRILHGARDVARILGD